MKNKQENRQVFDATETKKGNKLPLVWRTIQEKINHEK